MGAKFNHLKLSGKLLVVMITIPVILVVSLIYYSAWQVVNHHNKAKEISALVTSNTLIDKIDRNFYERFGDVQAFAYNRLAVQALKNDSADLEIQDFINTMTAYYVLYDLMMIVNAEGRIIAINSVDKSGAALQTSNFLNKNVSKEQWFKACMSEKGPSGGAFYSDFNIDRKDNKLYNSSGLGMDFAAPIKDKSGKTLGVWRNRAGWKEVTQSIRIEEEEGLRGTDYEAFILILNQSDDLIDAQKFITDGFKVDVISEKIVSIFYNDVLYTEEDYIIGKGVSDGAYTYAGKGWTALTIIPKTKLDTSTF